MDEKKGKEHGDGKKLVHVSDLAFFGVGFLVFLIIGWIIYPQILFSTKTQPIKFNHKVHIEGEGMSCTDCHSFRDDGTYAGFPLIDNCMECHEDALGESKAEAELIENYLSAEKEIGWISSSKQPDNVYFSHIHHIKGAKLECTECHKDVSAEEAPDNIRINWLTGYPEQIMKMKKCEGCHAEKGQDNSCFVCHK